MNRANHPTEGLSMEQLKGKGGTAYSRKLTKKDRIVYVVLEEEKSSYITISKSLQRQVVSNVSGIVPLFS